MNNKNIESRYTIEYIYPDSNSKAVNKAPSNIGVKLFFSISILGLLALGFTSSLYYPFTSNTNTPKLVVDTENNNSPTSQATIKVEEIVSTADENKNDITATNPEEVIPDKTEAITQEINKIVNNNQVKEIEHAIDETEISDQKEEIPQVTNNEVTEAPVEQEPKNNNLIEQLNNINQQLTLEKEKNKQLSSLVDLNKNKNNELSKMLKDALNKASTADTRYLNALSHLDDKSYSKEESTTIDNSDITDVTAQQIPLVSTTTPIVKNAIPIPSGTQSQVNEIIAALEKEADNPESNSLETSSISIKQTKPIESTEAKIPPKAPISQVDAIVAAMSGVNLNPKREATHPPTQPTIILQATETITKKQKETELLHIRLQQQINDLIITNELQPSGYNSALKTESVTRHNAVRSITVRKGDTLWDIARRAYGNGSYYKKIIDANPEVTKKGKIYLKEGQIIQVPI